MDEGKIIKYVRTEKGLSQSALANGLCTVRHLRNIENGAKEPSYGLLIQLSERLGIDLHLLVNDDIRKHGLDLYKKIQRLEKLYYEWKYNEVQEIVDDIMQQYLLEGRLYKRLAYFRAICYKENDDDYVKTKEKLLGVAELMSLDGVSDYLKHFRDQIDLDVINALAVNESYQHHKKRALEIFTLLKKHLIKFEQLYTDFGAKVLYNMAKIYCELKCYDESIAVSEESLNISRGIKCFKLLPSCYYYIARSHKESNNIETANMYYKKYLYSRYLLFDNEKAMDTINDVLNENELDLDDDIVPI